MKSWFCLGLIFYLYTLHFYSYILLEIILDIYERKETNKKETNGVNEMNVEDTARSYRFNII